MYFYVLRGGVLTLYVMNLFRWGRYLTGVLSSMTDHFGLALNGFTGLVASDIPKGFLSHTASRSYCLLMLKAFD